MPSRESTRWPGLPARSGVWLLTLAGLTACSSTRPVPGDDEPTLASLAERRVIVTPDAGPVRNDARAVAAYRALLAAAPASSPYRAPAQRRLADLEMALAEQRAGEGATPDYRSAIRQYQAWLAAQPQAAGRDDVLYQLARAHELGGEPDQALQILDRLVAAHPDSAHRDEAEFRRGELLFSARRWAEAEQAYTRVLQAGAGNPWLDRALYMQGWSRYRLGHWNEALDSLFGVLDLTLGADPDAPLSRAEQELVDDSLRVTALSLDRLQGAEAIAPHAQSERRQAYVWQVYAVLAALYQRQGRARDASNTYQQFALAQPLNPMAALARQRVVEIAEAAGFSAMALDARRDFVRAHAPEGAWARAQANAPAEAAQARRWWRTSVDLLAQHHHALAQRSHAEADVDEAQRWYRLAIDQVDDAERGRRRFLLAELLDDAGRQEAALEAYERAAYGPDDHARRADAGYSALLVRARLMAAEVPAGPATPSHRRREQLDAARRFVQRFDRDPRVPAVLLNAAQLAWVQQDGDGASTLAGQVLARTDAGSDVRRQAHQLLGDVAMRQGHPAAAEQAYAQALALVPDSQTAQATALREQLATAIYRQAEAERQAGRAADAARQFSRVARQAPGSAAAPAALYDGALQFIALKDWAQATQALQTLRRQHPAHALAANVSPQLALVYTESGQPREAAGELERWAATLSDPVAQRDARWRAAELYDQAGAAGPARLAYQRVEQDAAQSLPRQVQARWRLSEMAREQGRSKDEQALLRALRDADANGGSARTERTRTLGALATLRLAEPLRQAYQAVALVRPLKTTLARKKTRFDAVQAAYAQAAAAGTAEAQAAATTLSAALYQDFGRAVLASQRPRGMQKADAESYQVLLEEQAFPFEEKAVGLYRSNAERTRQGQYDEWVRRSYDALRELRPLRWGKREQTAAPDPNLAVNAQSAQAARLNREGLAHREAGRFDAARQAYEAALRTDPQHLPARLNRAILFDLYLHEPAQALADYRALVPLPGAAALSELPRWIAELESRLARQHVATAPEPRR
jgi:cellulose synthase operon protein C